jgi:hypothetical protein
MKCFLLDPTKNSIWREVDVPTSREEKLLNDSLERLAKEKGLRGLDLPESKKEIWVKFKTMFDSETGEEVGFFYKISEKNYEKLKPTPKVNNRMSDDG